MTDLIQGVPTTEVQQGEVQQGEGRRAQPEGVVARQSGHRRLTEEQQRTLGMITQGISIRDAGQQLGVHRGTIYRWLKIDPYFRAAHNAWQLEQQESCRAALLKAAEEAVVRIINSIPMDPNLAWRVIKELGILSRPKPLPISPPRVEMEIALEDHEEESALLQRIQREVDGVDEVVSPRGNLARLLRLKSDAEFGVPSRLDPPESAPSTPEASEPSVVEEDVSRA